jgi:hypothetical protein
MRAGTGALLGAAALGAGVLLALLPRLDIVASQWKPTLGRDDAIARATALARQRGVELSGWRFAVTTSIESDLLDLWPRQRSNPLIARHRPLRLRVVADSGRGEAVQVTLASDGALLGYVSHARRRMDEPDAARREFIRYVGGWDQSYQRTADGVRTRDGQRSAWERTDANLPGVLERVEVTVDRGTVVASSCSLDVSETAQRPGGRNWESFELVGVGIFVLLILFGVSAPALWYFFASFARRGDHARFGLRFLAVPLLGLLVSQLGGEFWNRALAASFAQGRTGAPQLIQTLLTAVFALLALFLLVSAGYGVLPRGERWHWVSAALVTRGRLWNRPVGRSVALGLAGGVALAALPYAIAFAAGLSRVRLFAGRGLPGMARPELDAWSALAGCFDVATLVGFLLPWAAARIERRWLRWMALALAGTVMIGWMREALPDVYPLNVAMALPWTLGLLFIYRVAGLDGPARAGGGS